MDAPRTTIDLKRMAAEVSVQHGIRVDPDDPMMAVVTLNRLIFEQAIAQVLERVEATAKDFETAAEKVQVRAGGALAQEVREFGVAIRQEVGRTLHEFRQVEPGRRIFHTERSWLVAGLIFALAIFGLGIWVGERLR